MVEDARHDHEGDPPLQAGGRDPVLPGEAEARPVLCTEQAADLLGISRSLLFREIKRGNIPHKRVGRRLVFSRQRLLEWLAADQAEMLAALGQRGNPARSRSGPR